MSGLFINSNAAWAALIIIVLPLVIIGAGEFEERLRQRDSKYRDAISILRVWAVPLLAGWVLARVLFSIDQTNVFVRLLASAVLLSVAAAALSALRVVVSGLIDRPRRSGRRAVPRLLLALPRLLVILATAWFLIDGVWGVDLSAALTALGVTSLVISFALQDTLGGIASGFTLLADQPFSPGDWIESETVEGRVIDVNWRSTRIQNRNGDLVVIPNGQLANATITNYDQPTRLHRVMVPVQIERTAPPTAAKEMLLDAARSTPGVLTDPPPLVFVTQIADPVVDYQAYMWIDDYAIAPRVKADFGSLVWYLSYRHDVPLPNPAQDLYLFDGPKTALESRVTTTDIRRRITAAPLMNELDDDIVDQMASAASVAGYQKGETILAEGDHQELLVLNNGRARLLLRSLDSPDVAVLEIEAGEVLGVLDEPLESNRAALIVALTDCDVVRIPPEAAGRAVSLSPNFAAVLDQLAVTRRRRIERVLRRTGDRARAEGADQARQTVTAEPNEDVES
jgi:small-conductance mechanosensitive channel/CRP-like cAMP-binding protein